LVGWLVKHQEIFAFGFYSTRMVLHSTLSNAELLSIECGGLHRAYDFIFHKLDDSTRQRDSTRFSFAFYRDKNITIYQSSSVPLFTDQHAHCTTASTTTTLQQHQRLYDGDAIASAFHAMATNDAILLVASTETTTELSLQLVSGGEDTTMKVFEFSSNFDKPLVCSAIVRGHPSSVRCIVATCMCKDTTLTLRVRVRERERERESD
jgi:hypothetical protein